MGPLPDVALQPLTLRVGRDDSARHAPQVQAEFKVQILGSGSSSGTVGASSGVSVLTSEGCMCDPDMKEDWNLSDLGASQAKDLSG